MKVGLYIVNQIRDITKAGYNVHFCNEIHSNMIRIEFTQEMGNDSFYEHEHLGYPECTTEHLEKEIIRSLNDFRTKYIDNPKTTE